MQRHWWVLLTLLLAACKRADTAPVVPVPDAGAPVTLRSVGPRLLTNATSTPLTITGEGLTKAKALRLGPPASLELPLTVLDERHAFARVPAAIELGLASEALID